MSISSDGAYGQLREGFLKFHQNESNIMLHLLTGGLGILGTCCLVYRCSNRSLGTMALLMALYVVSLVGAVPLELVLSVLVFLMAIVMPTVKAIDLGVAWSVVIIVLAYVGQDAAHFVTGEQTFQSSYTDADVLTSFSNATTWINNFSEHTFFLLPLTVDAAVPLLPPPVRSLFLGGLPTPAWLLSLQEHIWILAVLAVWVCGCFAIDSDSGPFPFMFVKHRMLKCNLSTETLRADLAAIRKWATSHKPSREKTTHWWFSDLTGREAEAFNSIATCPEVRAWISELLFGNCNSVFAVHTWPGLL